MKKILFILLIIIPIGVIAQDYEAWELPEYTTVANDSTDVLYLDDSGIDKHVEMPTILGVINDTADVVRGELADTAAQLRSEIAGGGAWSASGDNVYLTSSNDSVGIGTNAPTEKLQVTGSAYVSGDVRGATLSVGNPRTGVLSISGDNLMFTDGNNTLVSLSSLVSGGLFSATGSTWYATDVNDSWHFGSNTSTTHKLKVTGAICTTDRLWLNDYTYVRSTSVSNMTFGSTYYGGMITLVPDGVGGTELQDAGNYGMIRIGSDYLRFRTGTTPVNWYLYPTGVWTDGTDSLATQAYARANGGTGGLEIDLEECADCDTFVVAHGAELAYRVGAVIGSDTTHFSDSIYLDYAVGDYEQWLGLTTTGGVFADSLTDAGFMLSQEILPIEKYIKDIYSNELLWLYKEKGIVKESIGLSKLKPTYQVQALMGGIERAYRYIYVLHEKTEVLESELRKTQSELDELKRSYDFRLRSLEAEASKKVNVNLK